MKVMITQQYKSIPKDLTFELPDFTVITGPNGSGKTHLFIAMSDNKVSSIYTNDKNCEVISYMPFNSLNPGADKDCDAAQISHYVKNIWKEWTEAIKAERLNGKRKSNTSVH